jgi:16S rRNA (uracil1498-N3)-methyltransferase
MTPRLLLGREDAPDPAGGVRILLDDDRARYLLRVLRLRVGETVEVFDGEGARRGATLVAIRDAACVLELEPAGVATAKAAVRSVLLEGISTADKMEWTVEKAVELGVDTIVPVQAERGQVRLDDARAVRRHAHWQRLTVAACMQSGRDRLPRLLPAQPLTQALSQTEGHRLLLHPPNGMPAAHPLSAWTPIPPRPSALTLLAGPESGWSTAELRAALASGAVPIALGPRVLRTETAALAAVAALQIRFGDF